MSGQLFWGRDVPEPIHKTNQPHLLFYLFAGVMAVTGVAEPALHVLMSLFAFAAIIFFYLIAAHYVGRFPLYFTALFCLSPVLMPSQNLMTDVPMTAGWLGVIWFLIKALTNPHLAMWNLMIAALLAGFTCLIKSTALPLIVIVAMPLIINRNFRRYTWVILIPIAILALWSVFNLLDYGGIHISERNIRKIDYRERAFSWTICLGSMSPFVIAFFPYFATERKRRLLMSLTLLVGLILSVRHLMIYMAEPHAQSVLRPVFFSNGLCLISMLVFSIARICRPGYQGQSSVPPADIAIVNWLIVASAFVFLFSPFMAFRHFLPIIPAILLIIGKVVVKNHGLNKRWAAAGVAATAFFGSALAVSDWLYADTYRKAAGRISENYRGSGATLWYVGHWGWQWYAEKAGMKAYDSGNADLAVGDLIVIPEQIEKQRIALTGRLRLSQIETIPIPGSRLTRIRAMLAKKGIYSSDIQHLPWTLSCAPLETFRIVKVAAGR